MTTGTDAIVTDTVRNNTIGGECADNVLDPVRRVKMLAQTVSGFLGRKGSDPAEFEDIIAGCVCRVGEQTSTIEHIARLATDLPQHVPSTVVEDGSGTSQQTGHFEV